MEAAEREVEALDRAVEGASAGFGVEADQRGNRNGFDARSLRAGTRVRVVDLGVEAELVSEPDAEGKVMLRRGSWSINTHVNRLAPAQGEPPGAASRGGPEGRASQPASPGGAGAAWEAPDPTPALDIDLRGMEVDQALRTLDEGLDRGVLSGLSELRIIHGVGRGILRAAVERHLRRHPQVAGQRLGQLGEGGRGVTVATLR
jgi:DNA mismatch repair protein MutS2